MICTDCLGVVDIARGRKFIKCIKCGGPTVVNVAYGSICEKCSDEMKICQRCGKQVEFLSAKSVFGCLKSSTFDSNLE